MSLRSAERDNRRLSQRNAVADILFVCPERQRLSVEAGKSAWQLADAEPADMQHLLDLLRRHRAV